MSCVSIGNTVNYKLFNTALNSLENNSRVRKKTIFKLLNSVGNQVKALKEYRKDDINLEPLSKKEAESLLKALKIARGVYDKQHSHMPVKGEILDAFKERAQERVNAETAKENIAAAKNIKSNIQKSLITVNQDIQDTTLSRDAHEGNRTQYIKLYGELNKIKRDIENLLLNNNVDPFSHALENLFRILDSSHKKDEGKIKYKVAENIASLQKLTGKSSSAPVFNDTSNQMISLCEKYIKVNKEFKSVYDKMVSNLNPEFKKENPAEIKTALNNKLEMLQEQRRILQTAMALAEEVSNNPTRTVASEILKNLEKNFNSIEKG